MTVVINLLIVMIANILCAFPFYIIPYYKISGKKFALIYSVFGFLASAKYFFPTNGIEQVIITNVSLIVLILIFALTLRAPYYRVIIAFVLFAIEEFSMECFSFILGIPTTYSIYESEFGEVYAIYSVYFIVLAVITYYVVQKLKGELDRIWISNKTALVSMVIINYCSASQFYVNGGAVVEDFKFIIISDIFIFLMIFIIIIRSIVIERKNYIDDYNAAVMRETEKLNAVKEQNQMISKLRHDYINQITMIKEIAAKDPKYAIELLNQIKENYDNAIGNL